MTPLFPAQRAAEEFDRVLGGTAPPAVSERYADLLGTVEVLRDQPEVLPRAEFASDLRTRLMAAAEVELATAAPVRRLEPRRTTSTRRRLGTLAASLVVVGGTAGMAAASSGALPGEPLYPIKRGIEEISTAVRPSEASQGRALLDQAATRMDEVRALQAGGSADDALLARTIDAFRASAEEGSGKLFTSYQAEADAGDIEAVRSFTSSQMAVVADVARSSDEATEEQLRDAADTLADIDQQARRLCSTCGAGAAVLPPDALVPAAAAASVQSLLARPVAKARADVAAAEAERLARIEQLQAAAEETALTLPKPDTSGATTSAPTIASDRGSVSALLPRDSTLAPSLSEGTATVKNLVTGVTGTVNGTVSTVTEKVTQMTEPNTPLDALDPTVEDLGKTVDETTEGLLP